MFNFNDLDNLDITKKYTKCGLCENNCNLTLHNFNNKKYITGNRCDRPIKKKHKNEDMLNMYEYINEIKFNLTSDKEIVHDKVIYMPRVLNMYENYPLFYYVFRYLGFDVKISPRTTKEIYEAGMDTIPSESLCYPAKVVNGHIDYLITNGAEYIFYPSIIYEAKERKFSCPVVTSYPEVIDKNLDVIDENNVKFLNPFLVMDNEKDFINSFYNFLNKEFSISKKEVKKALDYANEEVQKIENEIFSYGLKILELVNNGEQAICLAGRPYHIDAELTHGIDRLISEYGFHILTEDFLAKLETESLTLRVVDQWKFHSRLYKAASYVGKHDNIELVQLNSFGCGLDAITTDQVKDILNHHNKIYTCLKIDEGDNLGAVRIRIRSLKAAIDERREQNIKQDTSQYEYKYATVNKSLKDYKIYFPQMSPFHFKFIEQVFVNEGYDVNLLEDFNHSTINTGLKFVNNDSCYPALVVIGQLLEAVQNLDDTENVALLITQTGGGCRASNYISLLRRALESANLGHIPVISLNAGNIDDTNTFFQSKKDILGIINKTLYAAFYGDLLMKLTSRVRPYEINKGNTEELLDYWNQKIISNISSINKKQFNQFTTEMISDFNKIDTSSVEKPKVGIVGEILVKYHPGANNDLVSVIEENGGEAVLPEFVDFFLYSFYNHVIARQTLQNKNAVVNKMIINFVEKIKSNLNTKLEGTKFSSFNSIYDTAKNASEIVNLNNKTGEGWYLTGEMVSFVKHGVPNIVCTQPFGCLPNHITGKGMFKKIRELYPTANICPIDYDPGASEVNQISRIKLMMSVAN